MGWAIRAVPISGTVVLAVVLALMALVNAESASAAGSVILGDRASSVMTVARAPSLATLAKGARVQYSSPKVGGLRLRTRGPFGGLSRACCIGGTGCR